MKRIGRPDDIAPAVVFLAGEPAGYITGPDRFGQRWIDDGLTRVMNLSFTPEQDELRSMVRRLLDAKSQPRDVRRAMDSADGFDPNSGLNFAELGLAGLAIPEEFGGAGYGPVEVGIVMEEAGRALLCAPYFSSVVLASTALLESRDDERRRSCCPSLQAARPGAPSHGSKTAAVGMRPGSPWPPRAPPSGWTLTGSKSFVIDGHTADHVIVAADVPRGASACSSSNREPRGCAAPRCRPWTRPASRPGSSSRPSRPGCSARRGTAGRCCAEHLTGGDTTRSGTGRRRAGVLDMAVGYAKVRVQFGRPIGSFQAIKHTCADMLLKVESARSAAYYAPVGGATGRSRAAGARQPGEVVLLRGVLPGGRRTTSRSTAVSASPGSTPHTCTSSAPRRRRSTSATPLHHRARLAEEIGNLT